MTVICNRHQNPSLVHFYIRDARSAHGPRTDRALIVRTHLSDWMKNSGDFRKPTKSMISHRGGWSPGHANESPKRGGDPPTP